MKNKRFLDRLTSRGVFLARTLSVLVLIIILTHSGLAQTNELQPSSFSLNDRSQDQVDRKVLPKIDPERLLAEDRARDKDPKKPQPLRFAVAADVAFNLDNSGTWTDLPDGRLWRLRIQSPGANSLNLGITRFDMTEGAKLWIYDPGHKEIEGPYTSRDRSRLGSLWTPIIGGDEIVVEVFVPKGVSQPRIEIRKANRGYRGFGKSGIFGSSEGTCETDVICAEGNAWRNQIRAVNLYTISGTVACTGTLMNNTAQDRRRYVLSANHCGVNSAAAAASIVVFWNFESATCGTHGPGPTTNTTVGGADLRARNTTSDFVLFELTNSINPAFNVFYAGWDRTTVPPPGVESIHHPSADVKAISPANTAPFTSDLFSDTPDAAGAFWRVVWDGPAVTEEGSSGSCIFATDTGRCIGTLTDGPSACGVSAADRHDFYGRFDLSWTGGGTDNTRLSNWLDPTGSNVAGMDGDPHITTTDGTRYDFQGAGEYVSLRDPDGLEIQTRMTPIGTTFTPGADSYSGLATCVSLNSAVAARVGRHRVTIQPNISGVPDPSGLQVRIDGVLTPVGAGGVNLGPGARIDKIGDVFQVMFPNNSVLTVIPAYWDSQGKWYLIVEVRRGGAEGIGGNDLRGSGSSGGLMSSIASGSWLPALSDGTSLGPMPGSLNQRYDDLYKKFGESWRVTDRTSLFDYAPGTSTATFTDTTWPKQNSSCNIPASPQIVPIKAATARKLCGKVTDKNMNANCVFDVINTGESGFAKLYLNKQKMRNGYTTIRVSADKDHTVMGKPVTFTATVKKRVSNQGVPTGMVQFTLNGGNAGPPIRLDAKGRAKWTTSSLPVGKHEVLANYIPDKGNLYIPSSSPEKALTVEK
ncbi:MAG TPA: Ig-like domain repeat protein [Pyrinomonadaceae bacterium]|jgi:hypothetical protein|nr:Ig-like domain repeat protein [Pyrinomonadaceae bacterium]